MLSFWGNKGHLPPQKKFLATPLGLVGACILHPWFESQQGTGKKDVGQCTSCKAQEQQRSAACINTILVLTLCLRYMGYQSNKTRGGGLKLSNI